MEYNTLSRWYSETIFKLTFQIELALKRKINVQKYKIAAADDLFKDKIIKVYYAVLLFLGLFSVKLKLFE